MRALIGTILTGFFAILTALGVTVDDPDSIISGIDAGVTALLALGALILAAWGKVRLLLSGLLTIFRKPQ